MNVDMFIVMIIFAHTSMLMKCRTRDFFFFKGGDFCLDAGRDAVPDPGVAPGCLLRGGGGGHNASQLPPPA